MMMVDKAQAKVIMFILISLGLVFLLSGGYLLYQEQFQPETAEEPEEEIQAEEEEVYEETEIYDEDESGMEEEDQTAEETDDERVFQEVDIEELEDEMLDEDWAVELDVKDSGRFPADLSRAAEVLELQSSTLKLENLPEEYVSVIIPEGAAAIQVGYILDQAGVMSFSEFNRVQLMFDISTDIRAGTHYLPRSGDKLDVLEEILITEI
ncbi:hypothetical protein SAMN04488692_10895 [Halarsenatibacter silvermanii]|uniref:Uncharacterized protein n=2 Tax=Halarsenatibacter silvermanii TaxID=321763 RepID=A0A1G9MK91_9FIRM|nr:hypothetical protein SAMN04488692_10895 [Halarsenatibacter silvermanii]